MPHWASHQTTKQWESSAAAPAHCALHHDGLPIGGAPQAATGKRARLQMEDKSLIHLRTVRSTRKGCPLTAPRTATVAAAASSFTTSAFVSPRPKPPCSTLQ